MGSLAEGGTTNEMKNLGTRAIYYSDHRAGAVFAWLYFAQLGSEFILLIQA